MSQLEFNFFFWFLDTKPISVPFLSIPSFCSIPPGQILILPKTTKVNTPIPPTHPQQQHPLSQPPGPRRIAPKPFPLTGVSICPKPYVTMAQAAITITTASGIGQLRPQSKHILMNTTHGHTITTMQKFTTNMTSSSSMTPAGQLGNPTLGPPLTNIHLDLPSAGTTHSAGSNLSDLSFSSTDLNSAKILSNDGSSNSKNIRVDDDEEEKVIADIKHLNEEEKEIVNIIDMIESGSSSSEIPSNSSSSSSSLTTFYNPNSSISPATTTTTPRSSSPSSSPCTTVANVNTDTWAIIKGMMAENKRQKQEREELQLEQQQQQQQQQQQLIDQCDITITQNSTMGLFSTSTSDNSIALNPYNLQHSERVGLYDTTSSTNSSFITRNHQPQVTTSSEKNVISTNIHPISSTTASVYSSTSPYTLNNSNERFTVLTSSSVTPPSLFSSSSSLPSTTAAVNIDKINKVGGAPPDSLIMLTGSEGLNITNSINMNSDLLQTTDRLFPFTSNNPNGITTNNSNIDDSVVVSISDSYHQSTPSTVVDSQSNTGGGASSTSSSFMDSDVVQDFRNQPMDTVTTEQMRTNLAKAQEAERLNIITNGNSNNARRPPIIINNLQNSNINNSTSMMMDVDISQNDNPNLAVAASAGGFDSFTQWQQELLQQQQQQQQQNIFVINPNDTNESMTGVSKQQYNMAQLQALIAQQQQRQSQQQQQQQQQSQQQQNSISDNDDFPDSLTIDTNLTCQPATLSSLLRDVSPDRSLVTDMDPLTGSRDQVQSDGASGVGEVEGDVDSWFRTIFVDTPKEPKSGAGGYGVPPLSAL